MTYAIAYAIFIITNFFKIKQIETSQYKEFF